MWFVVFRVCILTNDPEHSATSSCKVEQGHCHYCQHCVQLLGPRLSTCSNSSEGGSSIRWWHSPFSTAGVQREEVVCVCLRSLDTCIIMCIAYFSKYFFGPLSVKDIYCICTCTYVFPILRVNGLTTHTHSYTSCTSWSDLG